MVKVSRPIIYAVVAGVAAYAVMLLTEPEKPVKKPTKRSTLGAATKAPAGFLPEDMTAQFDRYQAKSRDAFRPGIVPKQAVLKALPSGSGSGKSGGLLSQLGLRGSWTLTGINTVNGSRSALIENSTTGDSAFLKTGDSWNGLQVVAVEADTVVFLNTLGQRTQLKFVDPNDESTTTSGTSLAPTTVPGAGSRTTVTVTPINKNGLTITPGGVAPVIPALPAATAGSGANVSPTRGRQR